MGLNLKNNYL